MQVKNFLQKIKSFLVPELKLTQQEQSIDSIIEKLLASSKTQALIDPVTHVYYLSNEELPCYVRIAYNDITIVNSVGSTVRACREKFRNHMYDKIDRVILKYVEDVEQGINSRMEGLLKEIESEIKD